MDDGGGLSNNVSYSSGEEDGDAEWRAAISSVSNTGIGNLSSSSTAVQSKPNFRQGEERIDKPPKFDHYQIKIQKQLEEKLDKTLEIGEIPDNSVDVTIDDGEDTIANGGGIRLFKNAPPGVVFDHIDELQGPTKRPNLMPGKEIDEKSKQFKKKLQSVAVDGADIVAAAEKAYQKSLAWLEAKDSKAKEAAQREATRVAELKRIRGEKWLPSVARDMQAAGPIIKQTSKPMTRHG